MSLKDILGRYYPENGLSIEQMTYLYNAVQAVQATEIDHNTLSFVRSQVDREASQKVEHSINGLRHALIKDLVKR